MGLSFLSIEPPRAREWLDTVARRNFVVTGAQHNAFVAVLAAARDAVADPANVLRFDMARVASAAVIPYPTSLPQVPYLGADRALRGTQVPVIGAVPPPAHWRTGGAPPADAPVWVRESDAARRAFYGALTVALEGLAAHDPAPATGAPRSGEFGDVARVVLATMPFGAFVVESAERAETDRVRVREQENTARFAQQCATVVQLYVERLKVFKETGTMPPASAGESVLNPYSPDGRPTPTSPEGRGLEYWANLTLEGGKIALVGGAVAGGIALAVYAWRQMRAMGSLASAAKSLGGARAAG